MSTITEIREKANKFYDKNYSLCVNYFLKKGNPINLGDVNHRVCRFCGRSEEDGALFNHDAHAVSNLIGNDNLFSYYECDDCNSKFARYEREFAEFMKPFHCFMQVKGKHKIPSIQLDKSQISAEGNEFLVNCFEGDDSISVNIDKEHNFATFEVKTRFIPIEVYRALLKMALSIMPENELPNVQNLIKFIGQKKVNVLSKLSVGVQVYGGREKLQDIIMCAILKRKETAVDIVPGYYFVLAYGNILIQMPLYGSSLDQGYKSETEIIMPQLLHPIMKDETPFVLREQIDLSGGERITKMRKIRIGFQWGEYSELREAKTNQNI